MWRPTDVPEFRPSGLTPTNQQQQQQQQQAQPPVFLGAQAYQPMGCVVRIFVFIVVHPTKKKTHTQKQIVDMPPLQLLACRWEWLDSLLLS